jgi:hypothetical protein
MVRLCASMSCSEREKGSYERRSPLSWDTRDVDFRALMDYNEDSSVWKMTAFWLHVAE